MTSRAFDSKQVPSRLHYLDGVRGWGALVVVMYHVFIEIWPVSPYLRKVMWGIFLFNGVFAVAVFFVVSGFSLSIGYIKSRDKKALLKMVVGRYFRLTVPIVLACMIAWLASITGATTDVIHKVNADSFSKVMQFAFVRVYTSVSTDISPIPPLWTMPFEIQGSAIVFCIVAIFSSMPMRLVICGSAAAVLLWTQPLLALFPAGILLADHWVTLSTKNAPNKNALGLFFVAVAAISAMLLPKDFSWAYVPAAILLLLGVLHSTALRSFLANSVSRWLGRISFPLYLLHPIVMYSFGTRLVGWLGEGTQMQILANLTIVAACLLIASLFSWIDTAGIEASKLIANAMISVKPRITSL